MRGNHAGTKFGQSAVGVVGNIEGLGLEKLGVKTDRGCVVIDGYGKTNVPGLTAEDFELLEDEVRHPELAVVAIASAIAATRSPRSTSPRSPTRRRARRGSSGRASPRACRW
mgnify:CR=1 FL=1